MRLAFLVLTGLIGVGTALADEAVRTGSAAFGDWRTDAPGVRRLITLAVSDDGSGSIWRASYRGQ